MHRTKKLIYTSAVICAVIILSACSIFKKEPKDPPAALVEFKPTMSIKTVWSFDAGASGDFVFNPVFVDNSIFTAAANGNIVRLDSTNGREIWKVKAESPLTAGVGADSSTLVVVGDKGILFAYDLDGKLRWKVQASSEILSTPAVGGGVVVVRSMNNHITAYDSLTGKRRWVIERTLPSLILRSTAGLVIADHHVFVGLPGGKLIAINLSSGSVLWEATVGEPRGATELERVADVSGTPIVLGSDICAAAFQGKVSCFDIKTGVLRWSKTLSTGMGVDVDQRFVFAVDDKGSVNAFSRSAGVSVWKNDKLAYRSLSSPISYGQAVAVADMYGYVHFLSREDGSFLARTGTDDSAVVATPILAGANVIFQTKAGEVVALAMD
jgi:outer membrane protein assembly factor BamB